MLNFTVDEYDNSFLEGVDLCCFKLTKNKYFDELADLGYSFKIIQTSYLDFCNSFSADTPPHVLCYEHKLGNLNSLLSLYDDDMASRLLLFSSEYINMLVPLRLLRKIVRSVFPDNIDSLRWDIKTAQTWPILGKFQMEQLEYLGNDLQDGEVLFAHIGLPHRPYVWDDQCNLARFSEWPANFEQDPNIYRSRYVSQVQCQNMMLSEVFESWKASGVYDKSSIVIHGDHGSQFLSENIRVNSPSAFLNRPTKLVKQDIRSIFSTFFAVKKPYATSSSHIEQTAFQLSTLIRSVLPPYYPSVPPKADTSFPIYGFNDSENPLHQDVILVMDQWLQNLRAETDDY
jgi:hypothetical protein